MEPTPSFELFESEATAAANKRSIKIIVTFSIVLLLSFIQILNWDTHSLSIIPLKAKQFIGLASTSDLREIADICSTRMKYDCVDTALTDLTSQQLDSNDLLKLGDLRRKRSQHKRAVEAYLKIFSAQENSVVLADAHYGIARSYEGLGLVDEAASYYQKAIAAKPEVIQITVTQSYINMLRLAGRNDEIEKVINEARRRGHSESLFSKTM